MSIDTITDRERALESQIAEQRKVLEQAVQVLLDIEQVVDLRSRWRNADEKRMDVVVDEAINAIQEVLK